MIVIEIDNIQSVQDFILWYSRKLVDLLICEPVLTKFVVKINNILSGLELCTYCSLFCIFSNTETWIARK